MLNNIDLNDKSYEELMDEAISQIPLYSKEWTNFNPSEPGITILENLTTFHLLQRMAISKVSEEVRRAMLYMLGYQSSENKGARLFLQTPKGEDSLMPSHMKLEAGTLPFETETPIKLYDWSLKAVYCKQEDITRDVTYLLDPKVGSMAPFGQESEVGNQLYLLLEGAPPEEREFHLWFQIEGEETRNPFPSTGGPDFSTLTWEYFTEEGWKEVVVTDDTCHFLSSGKVTMNLLQGAPALFTSLEQEGFCLRCTLTESHYDRIPRIETIAVNLFPVVQKETHVWTSSHKGGRKIVLNSHLAAKDFRFVYCKEEGEEGYRSYRRDYGQGGLGRFYRVEESREGIVLRFDDAYYGYGPCEEENAVRVVCHDEEMIHHRDLGVVYGYENQYISIDLVENLLTEECSLLLECPDAEGELEYHFVEAGGDDPDKLCYTFQCSEGGIFIKSPGMGTEYRLYLANCVTTQGAKGNISSGKQLVYRQQSVYAQEVVTFYSPSKGQGGVSWEDIGELTSRLSRDIRQNKTAVTPEDYEDLLLGTPGLCLRKAKAMAVSEQNLVRVVVMPDTTKEFPELSPQYVTQITEYLDEYRMLTTKVELLLPQYVPIHVSGSILLESNHCKGKEEVQETLNKWLNHMNGEGNFGDLIGFYSLHRALTQLSSVMAVENLRLLSGQGGSMVGVDVQMDFNSISYLGNVDIEFHTMGHR